MELRFQSREGDGVEVYGMLGQRNRVQEIPVWTNGRRTRLNINVTVGGTTPVLLVGGE